MLTTGPVVVYSTVVVVVVVVSLDLIRVFVMQIFCRIENSSGRRLIDPRRRRRAASGRPRGQTVGRFLGINQ